MADDAATTSTDETQTQLTFSVKAANDKKHVVTVPATATVADLKAKLATPEYADVPADRQRLIYSGRVLKDPDTLASAKIKDGHTVHLVKGAASNVRQNPANQGGSTAASGSSTPANQVPTNIAAGTGNNPLAGLTGARYAGFHGLPGMDAFGPDGGIGGPSQTPEEILRMMEDPMFLSQMNEALNNPAVIEMMSQNPMIRENPMLANMIRNPEMRRMMFNPEMMRLQLMMQQQMGGGPGGGGQRMAAPGTTDNTPQAGSTATGEGTTATPNQPNSTGAAPQDPFASLLGGAGAGANPFGNLFGPGGFNPPQQNRGADSTANPGTAQTQNPFGNLFGAAPGASGQQGANPIAEMTRQMMQNPEMMRTAMDMFGQMNPGGPGADAAQPGSNPAGPGGATGAAANPFAALFGPGGAGAAGFGAPPAPQDNRPPEEVYEVQL